MYYSLVGILAMITLFISNHDVFFKWRKKPPAGMAAYRDFLVSVAVFYLSDILWGVLEANGFPTLLILEGEDYADRAKLLSAFNERMTANIGGGVVISCGMADYIPGEDKRCEEIFARADLLMYERKAALKQRAQA